MESPNIHLVRGDDKHAIAQQLQIIITRLGTDFDPAMNLTRLDGKTISLDELKMAVNTLPFFGSHRLVILESAPGKLDKANQGAFTSTLENIPPNNHLIIIAEDHQKWRRDGGSWVQNWESLPASHWLIKWFSTRQNTEVIDLPLPDARQMDGWIVKEVQKQGGKIVPAAANELVIHTGTDTSVASQEISKLLIYVNNERAITREDVLELVSDEGSTDVFTMLDRLMEGRTGDAQGMMHQILDDSQPEIVLGAVIHRFRQLIQVCEGVDAGEEPAALARKTGVFQNHINVYMSAARRYGMGRLEVIYRRLLEMDVQSKTSQVDLATNLELFVLEAAH